MKNLFKTFLALTAFIFMTGCSNDDSKELEAGTSVVGTWKLVKSYGYDSSIGHSRWYSVKNGYTYTFKSDGTFISNRFSECTSGTYILSENDGTLSLVYDCEGFTTGIEIPQGTFVESFIIENKHLLLSPTYMNCVEGCDYKFKRIQ